ncbi:MAG: sulfotransferase [Gemmatimonadetes bacterium]|nr:sulfotransferase [Gemmatimonadota bacterium]
MALPDFIVIGAGRSGTTSLHHCLKQHPDIFMCPHKSPNYFVSHEKQPARENARVRAMARQWVSDRGEYENLFDGARGEKVRGEVSPVYLQAESAPAAIHEACPEAKLIAVLRNPIDRAYAHFLGRRRDGLEPRADFRAVVATELSAPLPDDVAFGSYLGCGRYHHFLRGYYERFPHERIRVFLFDDLRRDLPGLMREIYAFLDVDAGFSPDTTYRHNRTGVIENPVARFVWTRTAPIRTLLRPLWPEFVRDGVHPLKAVSLVKPELDPAIRADLIDVFREDVIRLQNLIGRDLAHWLQDTPVAR